METIELDGQRIAYRAAGSGPPLVLLHGGLVDSRVWRRELDAFSDGFRVVAWDAPGCGGSSDPPPDVVMEAGEAMGRYAGTRWPMEGTFTHIEQPHRLVYEARSWTAGEEDSTTIEHVTELQLREDDGETAVDLRVTLHEIGSGAKMAASGMKWGYKAQLDKLDGFVAR